MRFTYRVYYRDDSRWNYGKLRCKLVHARSKQQAICKILIGGENFDHLAEEIADATITLEQMRLLFNINDAVCVYMDSKVQRLDNNLRKGGGCHEG